MPDQNSGQIIGANNPQLTGWPVWLDARTLSNADSRPKVKGNSLEYLVISSSPDLSDPGELSYHVMRGAK